MVKCRYNELIYPSFEFPSDYDSIYQFELLAAIDTNRLFNGIKEVAELVEYKYKYKYKYVGLIPAKNGKLYAIPNDMTQVMEIDPLMDSVRYFGALSGDKHKYTGGCIDKKGIIYGLPRSAGTILRIDPYNRTAEEISLNLPYQEDRFYSGVLYEDRIYMMPRFADKIYVISLNDFSYYTIDSPANSRYAGCVLHPNGLIYCCPWGTESQVMVINPITDTICFIGKPARYDGFNLVVDPFSMNIYGFINYSGVIKIDVKTNKVSKLFEEITHHAFYGSELGGNGNIYSTLGHGTVLYEFNPRKETLQAVDIVSDGIDNAKCAGGCMDLFGNIWMAPAHGKYLYKIKLGNNVSDTINVEILTSPYMGNY